MDPEIYAQGRFITVYGKVGSLQKEKEKQLLVYAKFIYIWPEDFIPSSGWYLGIGPGFFFYIFILCLLKKLANRLALTKRS
ncbi:hypothetical protein [Methylacidiphilum sp. Yel]|uniref:hypothetical protein n=1 Tax=Methylacidiphilum sp. Yel TaxID=1847730 RepID=UPI0037442EB4